MSDKLKKYIIDKEADFDLAPSSGHFNRFKQKQLEAEKPTMIQHKNWTPMLMRVAAIFLVVFGISWVFFNLGKMDASQEFVQNPSVTNLDYTSDLADAEFFFDSQVSLRKKEVLAYANSDNEGLKHIFMELEKLELQYIDLKEELSVNNNNERIVNAMIENYRSRLDVLEKLLKQLKKSNQLKQKHHDQIQA